jgi:hypothetical protein
MKNKVIFSSVTMNKLLHKALYESMQENYGLELSKFELKLKIDNPGSTVANYVSLAVETNMQKGDDGYVFYSIERKTIERLCKVLSVLPDQPVVMSLDQSSVFYELAIVV